jgi:methanogenic corrinoid protein MtbC1
MRTTDRPKRSRQLWLSPKTLAQAIGVSESSLKRWVDEGLVVAERTAGGHRRIAAAEAVRFVRRAGLSIVRPDLLGLERQASAADRTERSRGDVSERLLAALLEDRSAEAVALILSQFVEGASLGWLCDVPIRQALEQIGELWKHGPEGIVVEHRAVETCLRALIELRNLLSNVPADAPKALGGSHAGDLYALPSAMAGLLLAEAGYQSLNLGPNTPVAATLVAVERYRPHLVWQSFSVPPRSARDASSNLQRIADALDGGAVVYGGRGSAALPPPPHPLVHRLDTMTELAAFARGISPPAVAASSS